jgi:secondary thiamine-phosphate synthase enzyme
MRQTTRIAVRTRQREEFVDLTAPIQEAVRGSGITEGTVVVYIPHTTCGVTVQENWDPDMKRDLLMALQRIAPDDWPYRHGEGNSPAHLKAAMMGTSVTLLVAGGELLLGQWQGVLLAEFDGPRSREVWVQVAGEQASGSGQ